MSVPARSVVVFAFAIALVAACARAAGPPGGSSAATDPVPSETGTATLPCDAEEAPWAAVEDRQAWLDDAVNYQVQYREGQVSGETGPHEIEWGRLIQLTVRSDTGSRLDIEASGREGIVSQNGTATFAFPAEPTGHLEVVMRETGATLLTLEVSCPT